MSAATTSTMNCIGEPISWPRLERFAASRADAAIRVHVEQCPACRACLDEIERDVVALPPLAIPEKAAPRRRWWTFAIPAGVALAAAAILLLVIRPRGEERHGASDMTQIKGVGTVELDLVRERAGVIRTDVRTFAAGDRWKVVVSCAADKTAWVDAFVIEVGANPDYPLDSAEIVCGNGIALPGAFAITGDKVNTVCVSVSTDTPPMRGRAKPGDPGVACIALSPE
jgi:hypothetical protein